MYSAGVSVRRIEDMTEALWGSKATLAATISEMVYVHIEAWQKKPLTEEYSYVYLDGIYLKQNRGDEYENMSV